MAAEAVCLVVESFLRCCILLLPNCTLKQLSLNHVICLHSLYVAGIAALEAWTFSLACPTSLALLPPCSLT